MATATYTTSKPSNWIKYPSNSTASSGGSHIVGWESGRYRIEKYSFTTGSYPITEININFGSVSHYGGHSIFNIYYYITTDSNYQNNINDNTIATELVNISNGKATARVSINLLKNTTYYIYVWSINLSGTGPEYWGAKEWSSSAATITATEIQTTNCSAPTSVTASGIVTPSGTFTVSWSGASGGTNNAISSYQVYWKVSSDGSAPTSSNYTGTKNITSTSTSGSASITLSSATRGYKVVCGVVARGSAGANYYSGIKTGGSVRINDLPNWPTLNRLNSTIPSTSNGVTVIAAAGSDNYSKSTPTVYYSTSSSGNKIQYTDGITINPNAGEKLTYYFWTYDGLEYSNSKSITITKNNAPTISINGTATQVTTYNALGGTGEAGSQLGYAYAIRPNITTNKTGTVKITIEMAVANSDSDTNSTSSYGYSYLLPNYSLTSTSAVNLNTYDIHTAVVSKFSEAIRQDYNIKWRLKFVLNDDIEDSEPVYYPKDNKFYSIAHAPSLLGSYNQFNNEDIEDTKKGEIWRKVRMRFYNDTSTPIVSITATATTTDDKNISLSATFTTSTSGNERYVDITLPDNISSNATINITASLTNTSASVTKKVNCTVTETPAPAMGPLTHAGTIIYPFTDTGTYQISMAWPFGNYENINTALTAYNCSTNINESIKFIHASDTSGNNSVVKVLTWSKNSNTIAATLNGSTAYGWKNELGQNELGYDTYAGQKTYYCQLQITNLFGKTYTSDPESGGWLSRIFDFNEKAQNLKIESIQWATSNNPAKWESFTTGSNGNAVQEGIYLKFNLSFDLFTEEVITVQLKRKINNEENIPISKTYSKGGLEYAVGRKPVENKRSLIYGPVGTISDTENRIWNFQIISTRGTAITANEITMKVQRQTAPNIDFTSCSVDQNYKISYSFEQTDSGGGSIANYLCNYDNKNELLFSEPLSGKPSSNGTYSGTVVSNSTNWGVKSICIKSVSTVDGLIKLEKEYYSNYIIVYKVSPTVAYRKNQLGINTDNPDNDAILTIYPSSDYKKIRFIDGRGQEIELDLIKPYNNSSYPAITVKKDTTEYTLFFD